MSKPVTPDCKLSFSFEAIDTDRREAVIASARRLLALLNHERTDGVVWSLTESLWPALMLPEFAGNPLEQIKLRVVPLTRIGQMEGKSGSLVLIGFFVDYSESSRPHSHPVVIKSVSKSKSRKLEEEYENSIGIKPFVYDRKDDFAIPIHFDDNDDEYSVLWSIFSPSDSVWPVGVEDSPSTSLRVEDLRSALVEGSEDACKILETSFRRLRNLHLRLNRSRIEVRQFGEEYHRYLRKLDDGVWGKEWREVWGEDCVQTINDCGSEFANPFWVWCQLRTIRKPLFIGAVHGDLHPGNIVLTENQPRIIDFGWAQDNAHVAKDFVLMECNLRFHTVRPQLSQKEVYLLSDWIAWGEPIPDGLGAYSRSRAELVSRLRLNALSILKHNREESEVDWDWEYIVPLFIVSFGLMRVAPHLGNQQAAVRFVLALSSYVANVIASEGTL